MFIPCISIIFPKNNNNIWSRIKNITLESASIDKITIYEKLLPIAQCQTTTLQIPPGLYAQKIL